MKNNNNQYTIIVALLLIFFSIKASAQTCPISLNDSSPFVFSSSGGIQTKSYTTNCSSPTITFSGVPTWLTVTAESGNIIKVDCPARSEYYSGNINILVNGNPMNGFTVTQGVEPQDPCVVTGFGSQTYDSFGETIVFPLTFTDCSPATSATFTFQTSVGLPVPDWISITQTGTSISVITSPHDFEDQQRPILLGTAIISGDNVTIGGEVKQNSCLQTWYKDVDGDGYAALTTRSCNSPGTGYSTTVMPLGDCNDGNTSINPTTIWYLDADGDGYAISTQTQCTSPGTGYSITVKPLTDCNDSNASLNPTTVWYLDADGDGYAISTQTQCTSPGTGYSTTIKPVTDCNDSNASLNPTTVWYLDADADGHAVSSQLSCGSPGSGYTTTILPEDDCDDSDSNKTGPVVWYADYDGNGLGDPNEQSSPQCTAPADFVLNNTDPCPISLNDSSPFVFSSSGGIQTKSYTTNCSSPTITFSGVPTWLTVTAESGNIIKVDCPARSEYYSGNINILVNGNPMNGFTVTQGIELQDPCVVTGFGNQTYDSFGETIVFPLTFTDCSPATSATFTFQTSVGLPVPDWISITQTGTSISVITSPHDFEDQQRPIIKGTAQISGDTVEVYAEVKQNSCLQSWYKDVDEDGYAELITDACNSPGSGYSTTEIPLGDCNDGNASINPTTIWYADYDGDGLGDPNEQSSPQCTAPANFVLDNTDACPLITDSSNTCNPEPDPDVTYTGDNYVYTRSYQKSADEMITDEGIDQNNFNFFTASESVVQQITYFDGLGRPIQQIGIDQTPLKNDIITHIAYDDYGRVEKEYLPYATTDSNLGTHRPTALTDTQNFYDEPIYENTLNAFSQKEFEPSPLNRVLKQAAPGNDWALGTGHEIELDYASNEANEVRLFKVNFINDDTELPQLTEDSFYVENELYKSITKDENHDGTATKLYTTEEFTDKQGRVVLKRTYAEVETQGVIAVEPHDTYYVYDDFGNLTYVLPPLMNAGDTQTTLADINNNMDALGYQYKYDYRNRLVEKQIPGKKEEFIVYNSLDQPVMTQDANQRENGEWLFTKYDVFGRVAYTGKALGVNTLTRQEVQSEVTTYTETLWEAKNGTSTNFGSTDVYYSNGAYPHNGNISLSVPKVSLSEILTINYYDSYDFDHSGTGTTVTSFGVTSTPNVKSLATGSKVKVLDVPGSDVWITTVSYYDDKARPIYSYSENEYLSTVDVVSTKLDFVGKPLKVRSSHTRNSTVIVTLDNFTYDHVGRLLSQTQCIGDQTLLETCTESTGSTVEVDLPLSGAINDEQVATNSITVTDATLTPNAWLHIDPNAGGSGGGQELIVYNDYDELGQLKEKKVGGDTAVSYTTAAGLQTINYAYNARGWLKSINDSDLYDTSNDLTINTEDLWGFKIKYNDITDVTKKLYNGNISQTLWDSKSENIGSNPESTVYTYSYDPLNRITAATGGVNTNYDVSNIAYDKNGNIQTLTRNGFQDSATFTNMDVLDYEYDNGNKLTKVTDSGNGAHGFKDGANFNDDYDYDDNGNMISDQNKGIAAITYNHLNLPISVTINNSEHNGTIEFVYAANGTKLQKIKTEGGNVSTTDYSGSFVYENETLKQFGQSEGYTTPNALVGFDYVYQYKDHLGSVRLKYSDFNGNGAIEPSTEIVQELNYYPFGMKHKGYNGVVNGTESDYKTYLGQEINKDLGLDWLTFRFRNYDPTIGRFFGADPISEKFKDISTYQFAHNTPIWKIELEGLEGIKSQEFNPDGSFKNHLVERKVFILTQKTKAIPKNASEKTIKKITRKNKQIVSKNTNRVNQIKKDITNSFGRNNIKNKNGEKVVFKTSFIIKEVDDTTGKSGIDGLSVNRFAHKNGIEGINKYGVKLNANAAVFTTHRRDGNYGSTSGSRVDSFAADAPEGTVSHEYLHTFGLPDNGYDNGGLLNSPPQSILSSEVQDVLDKSFDKIN